IPRPDAAGGRRQDRPLLLDVRAQVLLDEDHPGGEGVRGEAECRGGDVRRGRGGGGRDGRDEREVSGGGQRAICERRKILESAIKFGCCTAFPCTMCNTCRLSLCRRFEH